MLTGESSADPTLGEPQQSGNKHAWKPWLIPLGVICLICSFLEFVRMPLLDHQEILNRSIWADPARAQIWSLANIEIGVIYIGAFASLAGCLYFSTYRVRSRIADFGIACAYLTGSFLVDFLAVRLLPPLPALIAGSVTAMLLTLAVSRQGWFRRLLGTLVPFVFVVCGIGHFLEGFSCWHPAYWLSAPWAMTFANFGFAILVNAARFPISILSEDLVANLDRVAWHEHSLCSRIEAREPEEAVSAADSAKYRTLFETMTQGVVYLDGQGRIQGANHSAMRILALSPEDLSGSPLTAEDWVLVRDDGSLCTPGDLPWVIAAARNQSVLDAIVGICRDDDQPPRWLRVDAFPESRPGDEKPHSVCTVFDDITAMRAADAARERRLTEAMDRADRDPLTSLLNHRVFHDRAEAEAARARREGSALGIAVLDMDNFKFFNDVYGHQTGDRVLRYVARRLQSTSRSTDSIARFGGDEFALLLPGIPRDMTAHDLEAHIARRIGDLSFAVTDDEPGVPVAISIGACIYPAGSADQSFDWQTAIEKADERLRQAKLGRESDREAERIRRSMIVTLDGFSMLDALVAAVDNKDRYTRRHSDEVMTYSLAAGRMMGCDQETLHTLAAAALLHDVGKIGVPDRILRKPGRLTDAEYEAVKLHPVLGAVIVGSMPALEMTLSAIRHHHERWDGHGYPDRLKGGDCPLLARVIAAADAYSAMTTDRPYRRGMNAAEAMAVLKAGAFKQWDGDCVDALAQALSNR